MATFDELRRLLGDQAMLLGGQPLRLLLSTPNGSTRVDEVEVGLMLLPGGIPPQLVFSAASFGGTAPAEVLVPRTLPRLPRKAPVAPPVRNDPRTPRQQRKTFHARGLTDDQVKEIIADFRANNGRLQGRCAYFATKFGVTPTAIRCLYNGKTYLNLTEGRLQSVTDRPAAPARPARARVPRGPDKLGARGRLTAVQVREIVDHVREGRDRKGDHAYFARKFGVDSTTIGNIYHGKSWTHLTGGPLVPLTPQKAAKKAPSHTAVEAEA